MAKVITDKLKIDEVLTRGVENIYPDKASLGKVLASGRRIRLYCGFDPSAQALHIGNAIQINKLAQFQALGHEVIFLVGDFTGMIGDPTDKKAARKKMTRAEVLANARNYQKQASAFLDFGGSNPAKVMYNSAWSDPLTFRDLIEITSNFTVQQMIQRDMFQDRLKEEKPIYLHEFLYPVAQGYDSVGMDVDLEVGGSDQMFNMLCGRDLMRAIKGKEKYVLTTKLLADPSGRKMGKSEGNVVNLNDKPENIYGQVMSWPDGVIGLGFELCTRLPCPEVDQIKQRLARPGTNPRDLKMRLAFEIVSIIAGEARAKAAEAGFIKTIQKKEAPDEMPEFETAKREAEALWLVMEYGLAASKNEARRLFNEGAIRINGETVRKYDQRVPITAAGTIVQRGKLRFIRVKSKR